MANDISTPFPDVNLRDLSTLRIETGDSGAVITALNIHVEQEVPETQSKLPDFQYVNGQGT